MDIIIEGEVSAKDHYRAIREMFHRFPSAKILYLLFLVLPVMMGIMNVIVLFLSPTSNMTAGFTCMAFGIFYVFILLPFMQWWQVKSSRKSSALEKGSKRFEFSEAGLKITGSVFNLDLQWDSIVKVVQGKTALFLYTSNRSAQFIPNRMIGDSERIRIKHLVENRLKSEQVTWID